MALTKIIFLSFSCPLGIVYLYLGMIRKNYPLIFGGVALALYPLFFGDVRVLIALFIVLTFAPFAVNKLIFKKSAS